MTETNEEFVRRLRLAWTGKISLEDYRRVTELALRVTEAQEKVGCSTAVLDEVAAERFRQIEVEGWTPEHDDTFHVEGELAVAAACYATTVPSVYKLPPPPQWPWDRKWWKPKSRRRDLIRAAALLVAEIERLDRIPLTALGEQKP